MPWSEPEVLERLRTVEVPELRVEPLALVAEGQRRVRRRRWRQAAAGLMTAAAVAIGYVALAGFPGEVGSVGPAAPEEWVAADSDEVTVLDGVRFGDEQGVEEFTITLSRDAGETTTMAEVVTEAGGEQPVTREEGPPGVEVLRTDDSYLVLWSSPAEVNGDLVVGTRGEAGGGFTGTGQSAAFELAGQPMHYVFMAREPAPVTVTDLVLSTEVGVVTASGASVHEAHLQHQGLQWRLVWIPALDRWGECDAAGCDLHVRGQTAAGYSAAQVESVPHETVLALLPGDARDVHLELAGQQVGSVATEPAADMLFVVGTVEQTDEYDRLRSNNPLDVAWTGSDGAKHSLQDLRGPSSKPGLTRTESRLP